MTIGRSSAAAWRVSTRARPSGWVPASGAPGNRSLHSGSIAAKAASASGGAVPTPCASTQTAASDREHSAPRLRAIRLDRAGGGDRGAVQTKPCQQLLQQTGLADA